MNKKKLILLVMAVLITGSPVLLAQGSFQLPSALIEGKSTVRVKGGVKASPNKPPRLTSEELDSLNSLEKQQSFLLPPKSLPDNIMQDQFTQGYLKGEFGQFLTPSAEAGFGFRAGADNEYDVYFNGGYEISDGHEDNTAYDKGYAKVSLDYFAPDKFWIFGGSRTHTEFYARRNHYNLYSPAGLSVDSGEVPGRSAMHMHASLDNEGIYEGYKFATGARFNSMQLDQEDRNEFDNAIKGYLNVRGMAGDFEIGANVMLDLHSVRGQGVNFSQANAMLYYFVDKFSLRFKGGYQLAQNFEEESRSGLLIDADMEFRLNHMITLKGGIYTGLKNNTFNQLLADNPYLYEKANIDFNNAQLFKLFIYIHPAENFSVIVGANYGMNDRMPYFSGDSAGTFEVNYDETKTSEIIAELDWQPGTADNMVMNIKYSSAKIDSSDNDLPYIAPLCASLRYRRDWGDVFGTQIGINYIGEKYIDAENKENLDGYADLNAQIDYKLFNKLTVFGRINNILNKNIYVWEGYKERGMFLSGGILWRF